MAWAASSNKGNATPAGGTGNVQSGASPGALSIGDRVVVNASGNGFSATSPTYTVIDSLGNTYTEDSFFSSNTGTRWSTFSSAITIAGTPTFVRMTLSSGSGDLSLSWESYTGIATSSAKDVAVTTGSNSATAASGATGTTTGINELVVGNYADDGSSVAMTGKNGTGYTQRVVGSTNGFAQSYIEDKDSGGSLATQSSAMATNLPGTGANWAMGCIVYKLTVVAPVSALPLLPPLTTVRAYR